MNIAELLLSRKLLTSTQVDEAHALHTTEGLRLDRAIIQLGFLSEQSMLELMSEHLHLPLVKLEDVTIPPETLRALPARIVYRKRLIPIGRVNGTLRVAT